MAVTKSGKRRPGIGQAPVITVKDLLRPLLSFIRTDFGGGGNHQSVISQRLRDAGIPVSSDTEAAYRLGAEKTRDTIKAYMTPQVQTLKGIFGY